MSLADELRTLWGEIHTERKSTSWRDPGSYTETRAVTEKEWALVLSAIEQGFPVTLYHHGYFSGFALCVYEPSTPFFPGVEAEPEPVILLAGNQYPGNDPKNLKSEQKLSASSEGTGGVFEIFEKLCNTPENLARLKQEKIGPPKSRGHYQY